MVIWVMVIENQITIEIQSVKPTHACYKPILPVASDIPPLPDAVKSVFTDIRQEWNAPSVVEFGINHENGPL